MGGVNPGGNPNQDSLPEVSPEAAAAVFELEQLLTETVTESSPFGGRHSDRTQQRRVVRQFGQQLQPDGSWKLVGGDAARINEIAERFGTTGFEVFQMASSDLKGGNITSRLRHTIGPGDAARVQREEGPAVQAGQQVSTIEQENQRQGVSTGNAPARRSAGGRRRTIVSLDGSGGRPSILGD